MAVPSMSRDRPTVWSSGELRLLALAGRTGIMFGSFAFPAGVLAFWAGLWTLVNVACSALHVMWVLAMFLAVRIGTCGRRLRERDTGAWLYVRNTAKLAIGGPAVVGVLVAAVARLGETRELVLFMIETAAWYAVPATAVGVLFLCGARLLERNALGAE